MNVILKFTHLQGLCKILRLPVYIVSGVLWIEFNSLSSLNALKIEIFYDTVI